MESSYTNEEIQVILTNYKKRNEKMKIYSSNRYNTMKENLLSDNEELKKDSEQQIKKRQEQALNYYYNVIRERELNQKDTKECLIRNARTKYHYYKRNKRMDVFVTDPKHEDIRQLLKNDHTVRKRAENKYPELFC